MTIKRNPYKFRGSHTWALAKEAYLAGETAKSIAERLDLTESCMRRRMAKEGWRRRDHADAIDAARVRRTPLKPEPLADDVPNGAWVAPPAPPRAEPAWESGGGAGPAEAARRALADGAAAMAAGDYGRAATALKTVETLARLLAAHPTLDQDRSFAEPGERPFTPAGDVIARLAQRFGVEAKP